MTFQKLSTYTDGWTANKQTYRRKDRQIITTPFQDQILWYFYQKQKRVLAFNSQGIRSIWGRSSGRNSWWENRIWSKSWMRRKGNWWKILNLFTWFTSRRMEREIFLREWKEYVRCMCVCMYITMSMYYKRDYKKLFASLLGREHVHISATRGKNLSSTVLGYLVDAI